MAELVLGISGGVAAYKAAYLTSRLAQAGHGVTVVLTSAARKFVGEATFSALSGRRVLTDSFDLSEHPLGPHIELARKADLLAIVPATADIIAKAAHGMAEPPAGAERVDQVPAAGVDVGTVRAPGQVRRAPGIERRRVRPMGLVQERPAEKGRVAHGQSPRNSGVRLSTKAR